MEISNLQNSQTESVDIEIKEINDVFSGFRAVKTILKNGKQTIEKSEGISKTDNILTCLDNCRIPSNMKNIIIKNDEFLELVRVYGHPATLSDNYLFGEVTPEPRMKELMEQSEIKFDDVNDELLNKLIFVDYSKHAVINISDDSLCNVARFAENIHLSERKFKNYEEHVNRLIETNRIAVKRTRRGEIFDTHWGEDLRYVSAKVAFSDEEFNKIISMIKVEEYHFDDFYFSKACDELDLFGMTKDIKTEEEQEEDHRRNEENSY